MSSLLAYRFEEVESLQILEPRRLILNDFINSITSSAFSSGTLNVENTVYILVPPFMIQNLGSFLFIVHHIGDEMVLRLDFTGVTAGL